MLLHPLGGEPDLLPVFVPVIQDRRAPAHGFPRRDPEPPLEIADLTVGFRNTPPHHRDLFPQRPDFLFRLFPRESANFPPKLGNEVRHVSSSSVLPRTRF